MRGEDRLLSVSARYFGWQTRTFPFYFNHLKPERSKNSVYYESYLTGYYKGSIPYRLDYFLLTQVKHLFAKPIFIASFLQIIAYILSRYIIQYRPFPKFVKTQGLNRKLKHFSEGR